MYIYMCDPRKVCKMRCPHNLVLENLKYLLFYSTIWVVVLLGGLKLSNLSIHALVIVIYILTTSIIVIIFIFNIHPPQRWWFAPHLDVQIPTQVVVGVPTVCHP